MPTRRKRLKTVACDRYERLQQNEADAQDSYGQQEIDAEQCSNQPQTKDESGFDSTNSGDDRLYGFQIEAADSLARENARPIRYSTNQALSGSRDLQARRQRLRLAT